MPNRILPIQESSDDRSKTAQINANFAKLDADTVTKTFKGPTSKDAVVEGSLPGTLGSGFLFNDLNGVPNIYIATDPQGKPIMKVAKTGQDATTAPDDQLVFNSARNTLKIIQSGSTTVNYTVPATVQVFQSVIPHGLPYTPIVLAWQGDSVFNTQTILPNSVFAYDATVGAMVIAMTTRVVADPTNLTFQAVVSSKMAAPGSVFFRYYVIAESL